MSLSILSVLAFATAAASFDSDGADIRRTLSPDEFARFAPRTALDMARQVPGFSIEDNDNNLRGLGLATSNVLINGRRISGKSNGPVDALGRISADDVVRLEIIDGASLDIAGLSGQVLNVVTSGAGGVNGQFRYSPQFRSRGAPFRWGNGEVTVSGGGVKSEWTLRLENDQQRFGQDGPEFVIDGAGVVTETAEERVNNDFERPSLSGSYSREASNGNVFNFVGEVGGFIRRELEVSERSAPLQPDRLRTFRRTEDEFNFELSGDYAFAAPGGRLKMIGVYRYENSPTVDRVLLDEVGGGAIGGSEFVRQANEAEAVLRTEYTFVALDSDWQLSLEGARNFLDIDASLEQRDTSGVFAPVVLPGASSRVEENRAETTLSFGRTVSPRLQIQSTLGVEYSEITQTGDFGLTRHFVRPKGLASLNWRVGEATNISVKLERVVGQLNFFDFISSVNVNQDTVNVSNVELVPPQSWRLDLELQTTLGEYGSATLNAFAEDISDIVDQIPIAGDGQAPGNIDTAKRYGASANITLLSDPLGWKGTRLDLGVEFADSELLDPLLNTPRQISNQDYFEIDVELRQDFQGTNWAAGFSAFHEEETPSVRLDEITLRDRGLAFVQAFVENKDVYGLTLRARMGNVIDREDNRFRTVFDDRLAGVVDFREDRFRKQGAIFTFDIEGSF